MVEHLMGNMWRLESGEYVGESPEEGIVGPVVVRIHDHADVGLLGVQCGAKYVEVPAEKHGGFESSVKMIPDRQT